MQTLRLVERDQAASRFALTQQGRAVLSALFRHSEQKKSPA
jgi:hypothetical protein